MNTVSTSFLPDYTGYAVSKKEDFKRIERLFAAVVDEPTQFASQVLAVDNHINKAVFLQKF
jgi:hypothetical protein